LEWNTTESASWNGSSPAAGKPAPLGNAAEDENCPAASARSSRQAGGTEAGSFQDPKAARMRSVSCSTRVAVEARSAGPNRTAGAITFIAATP
jgi:hypothetical protein